MIKVKKKKIALTAAALLLAIGIISGTWIQMRANRVSPEQLIGQWQRQDGPYLLEILKVNDDQTLNAGYYNPKKIHIAKAEISHEKSGIKLFVELRDKGYPGSTYTLFYEKTSDILGGIYYHAGLKRRFNVFFVRKKRTANKQAEVL